MNTWQREKVRLRSAPDSPTTTETRERADTRDLRAWPPSVGAPTLLSLMAARSKLLPGAENHDYPGYFRNFHVIDIRGPLVCSFSF